MGHTHNEPRTDQEATLAVPSEPRYLRTLRLTATSLLTAWDLDVDRVEDLRVAVTEACTSLWRHHGRGGTVQATFSATPREIRVALQLVDTRGRAAVAVTPEPSILPHLTDRVLHQPDRRQIDLVIRR